MPAHIIMWTYFGTLPYAPSPFFSCQEKKIAQKNWPWINPNTPKKYFGQMYVWQTIFGVLL